MINLGVLVMELEKKADNGNEIDFDALIENVKRKSAHRTSGRSFSLKPGSIIHLLLVNILIYYLSLQKTLTYGKPYIIM